MCGKTKEKNPSQPKCVLCRLSLFVIFWFFTKWRHAQKRNKNHYNLHLCACVHTLTKHTFITFQQRTHSSQPNTSKILHTPQTCTSSVSRAAPYQITHSSHPNTYNNPTLTHPTSFTPYKPVHFLLMPNCTHPPSPSKFTTFCLGGLVRPKIFCFLLKPPDAKPHSNKKTNFSHHTTYKFFTLWHIQNPSHPTHLRSSCLSRAASELIAGCEKNRVQQKRKKNQQNRNLTHLKNHNSTASSQAVWK